MEKKNTPIFKNFEYDIELIYNQAITTLKDFKEEYSYAIEVAISVLTKQIAKTPDYEGEGYADGKLVYDTWICPNCGEHYEVGYHDYDYCPKCGQHIKHEDWESD